MRTFTHDPTAGWKCIRKTWGLVHIVPRRDLIVHVLVEDCVCGPSSEYVPNTSGPDGWLYVHHSLDGREAREDGR